MRLCVVSIWGISSAGRATDLHSVGQRFEPAILHPIRNVQGFPRMRVEDIQVEGVSSVSAPGGRPVSRFRSVSGLYLTLLIAL